MCIRDRLYIVLAIGVVVLNFERVPAVFHDIVYGAFNPAAVTGGVDVYKRQHTDLADMVCRKSCRHRRSLCLTKRIVLHGSNKVDRNL